jgi:hypothetical protein
LKMIEKKLTYKHMEMYTWWCWHICKGGIGRTVVCRVERSAGFGAFRKIGCVFSIAPDAKCG